MIRGDAPLINASPRILPPTKNPQYLVRRADTSILRRATHRCFSSWLWSVSLPWRKGCAKEEMGCAG